MLVFTEDFNIHMEAGNTVWPHLLDRNETQSASGNFNLFLNI